MLTIDNLRFINIIRKPRYHYFPIISNENLYQYEKLQIRSFFRNHKAELIGS